MLRALHDAAPGQARVWGVAAPSANRFGRVSPTTAAHVDSELGPDLLILDGGPCDLGIESTIIDCTRGAPVLLRAEAKQALNAADPASREAANVLGESVAAQLRAQGAH